MNNKIKIVSSIALAGLLTLNVFNTKTLAAEFDDKIKTEPVGVYRKLVEGKVAVPFVLVGTNDGVTVKEIINSDKFTNVTKFNGTSIPNENTLVSTGDTFVADGTEYTVIIYGDVNKDGKINSLDALEVEKYSVGKTQFDAMQKEVADVKNDEKINSLDSLSIKKYAVGLITPVIDKLPEEEVIEAKYSVSVNDNGKINADNLNSTTLKIKLAETLDKAKTLELKVIGADGKEVSLGNISIPAHTDYVELTKSFAGLKDGAISAKLVDTKTDETVATFTTEINTVRPEAAGVTTNRVSTKEAKLSLGSCGESDIVKVHYVVKKLNDVAPTKLEDLTNSIEVTNNKVSDDTIATDLETETAYKVYYVLENSYGSKSETIQEAVITKDNADVSTEKKVEKITSPDLSKTDEAKFTWEEAEAGKTYVVTLFKDGKAVSVTEKTEVTDGTVSVKFTEEMKEAGNYRVNVVVKGAEDGTSKASEITESDEVVVAQLKVVENLAFSNVDDKVVLSWTNANNKDDFKEYSIKLYTVDAKGEETFAKIVTSPATDKNEVEVTLNANTIYVAKVAVVEKDGQIAKRTSEVTTSEQFYKVEAPEITNAVATENTVTFSNVDGVEIKGKVTSYKVKVFDVAEPYNPEQPAITQKTTKTVELKDGEISIDGLDADKLYVFKLVASVDGKEVESDYTSKIRTLPEIKGVTVTKDVEEAKKENSGKIAYVNDSTIIINGKEVNKSDYNNSAKLAKEIQVIKTLKEGDIVTINGENVKIKLDGGASANVAERDFSVIDMSKITLDVESNNFSKTIITNGVKELTLRGTGSIFNVKDANAEKTVLTDGVEVVGDTTYTINANSKVTINKVTVETEKETEIKANGSNLVVKANTETNNLVFENKTETATITFKGLGDNSSEQSGTITIKSNGGKVTVNSDKVNVNAKLAVEINNGDVDIQEESLTGNKTVSVNVSKGSSSTIEAVASTNAPKDIVFTDFELKEYKDEELTAQFGEDIDVKAVRAYIESFGLNGKGAKLTTSYDEDRKVTLVTITFENIEEAVSNVTIGNIK